MGEASLSEKMGKRKQLCTFRQFQLARLQLEHTKNESLKIVDFFDSPLISCAIVGSELKISR
jgi:hypothetical protein